MPKSVGMTGSKWFRCDYSGFHFPVSERVYQYGYQVAARYADLPGGQQTTDQQRLNFADAKASGYLSWPKTS